MISLFTAVLVFLLGQSLLRLVVEPLMDQRRRTSQALHVVRMWGHIFASPRMTAEAKSAMINKNLIEPDDAALTRPAAVYESIRIETRKAAADLVVGTSQLIPGNDFWALFKIVPTLDQINQVHRELIKLSNSLTQVDQALPNAKSMDEVERLLGVPLKLRSCAQ